MHTYLDVQLVDFGEEGSDSVIRPAIVQKHELCPARRQKCGHVLLVEFVDQPEISTSGARGGWLVSVRIGRLRREISRCLLL